MDGNGARRRHLREQPPHWPRRDEEPEGPEPRRWGRELEPFEDEWLPELYPGAMVMDDMSDVADDTASLRILVRYTIARLLRLVLSRGLRGVQLRLETRIASEHLALLPEQDWERRTLERVLGLCREHPEPALVDAIATAAEASAKRGQPMGAFALYRAGYDVAVSRGWWAGAARAAAGIAMLARMEEARRSTRLWERRAAVLTRRADRAAT